MFKVPYGNDAIAIHSIDLENKKANIGFHNDLNINQDVTLTELVEMIRVPFLPSDKLALELLEDPKEIRAAAFIEAPYKGAEGSWMRCCETDWWFFEYHSEYWECPEDEK